MKEEIYNQCKTENERQLLRVMNSIMWMAIRYADGRDTYAPGMVRDAVKYIQEMYPDYKPEEDKTIGKPKGENDAYLYDLVNN